MSAHPAALSPRRCPALIADIDEAARAHLRADLRARGLPPRVTHSDVARLLGVHARRWVEYRDGRALPTTTSIERWLDHARRKGAHLGRVGLITDMEDR